MRARILDRDGARALGVACLLALVVAAVWWKSTGFAFTNLDDDQNLLANPHFRGLGAGQLGWMFSTRWMGHFQPLTWLSYGLDFARGGLDPRGYHTSNVLLHVGAALALFALARELLRDLAGASGVALESAAALAALTFALHPLRAEPVAWVTGRNDLLATPLLLLACLAWWRRPTPVAGAPRTSAQRAGVVLLGAAAALAALGGLDLPGGDALQLRVTSPALLLLAAACWLGAVLLAARRGGGRRYVLACGLLLLAGLSKEVALVAPLVFGLLDLLRRPRATLGERAVDLGPTLALALVLGVLAAWARGAGADVPPEWGARTPGEVLAQAAQALVFVPWKTLLPGGLTPIHDLDGTLTLGAPASLVALAVLGLGAVALALLRRRAPAVAVALLAYGVLAAPTLGLVRFGTQWTGERYSYLSSIPLHLLLGAAWLAWRRREQADASWARLAAILLLALCARAGLRRAEAWRDSEHLWVAALEVEESPRALVNLALVYMADAEGSPPGDARRALAVELTTRALELAAQQQRPRPEYEHMYALALQGAGRYVEALVHYERYLERRPTDLDARFRVVLCLVGAQRTAEARRAGEELRADVRGHRELGARLDALLGALREP